MAIEDDAHAVHDAYVRAINSNDLDAVLALMTDDVVFQSPGAPEVIGKAAVRDWIGGYLALFQTQWDKRSIGFTVDGDIAFERYSYAVTDTDKATGAVSTDTGKGINIFRRGADGRWRVAIDGWSLDTPPAQSLPSADQ